MVSTHANTGSPRVERCDRLTRDAVSLVRRLSGIRPLAVGTGTQPAARVYECAHVFTWIEQTARILRLRRNCMELMVWMAGHW